jgi:hypothetical protein
VKLLTTVVLAAVCLVVPAAFGRSTVVCSSPGDWPHTKDAAWLARALTRTGLGSYGCTGSAFIVDLGGDASTGQIYVWTTRGRLVGEPGAGPTRIAGVLVRYDRVRGVWRAAGRNVWVQTASSRPLLPTRRWARIVRATVTTPARASFRSVRYRYQVSYPSSWHRANRSLTPHLSDPHEILTVATGPLPVGGPRCAQVPVSALEAVGPTGALVSIQERAPATADGGFPPRPARFGFRAERLEISACLASRARPLIEMVPFSDRGRHFYALVAIGRAATRKTRDEALRVLDSLRFSSTH